MISDNDKEVLSKIVELEGDCLKAQICHKCPFKSQCLPEYLHISPPSFSKRLNLSLNILAHDIIFEDSEIKDFLWKDEK